MTAIIINFFKTKLLSFLKSKYFIYFLIIGAVLSYILFLNISIKNKDRKIKKLYEEIYTTKLEISNIISEKEVLFENERKIILESFSNSNEAIENIKNKSLKNDEINALNAIINNYYKHKKE
ncbi:OrfG [Brachyspira pilosicoli WesB]|uniref:OrfG n=1 Tax=Brachyspira pilosicoli WesB TaxID=1161918 RepID=K0JG88_BRAPL|nr:OrfG [Brachyspira pilosicoli WesB]